MTSLDKKIDQILSQQEKFQVILLTMASNMASKQDVTNLREELVKRFSHLPTKEQFYKKMDKWMKAVSTHDLEKASHKLAHKELKDHLSISHIL